MVEFISRTFAAATSLWDRFRESPMNLLLAGQTKTSLVATLYELPHQPCRLHLPAGRDAGSFGAGRNAGHECPHSVDQRRASAGADGGGSRPENSRPVAGRAGGERQLGWIHHRG